MNLQFFVSKLLNQNPDAIALEFSNQESVSYQHLIETAYKVFTFLSSRPNPVAPFLLSAEKTVELYGSVLTSLFMGIPFVPIHRTWPINKVVQLIKETKADTWIGGELHPQNQDILKKVTVHILSHQSFAHLTATPWSPHPLSDKAYYMTSSGSTGTPKLVLIRQQQFFTLIKNLMTIYPIKPGERVSNTYDLCFDPCLVDICVSFLQGGTLVPLLPQDQFNIFQFIKSKKINLWSSTPSLVKINRERERHMENHCLSEVRLSLFTGESLSSDLVNYWHGQCPQSEIENLYGPIESTVWATRAQLSKNQISAKNFSIPIGKPLPGFDFIILDPKQVPLSQGKTGELYLSGPQIFDGYENQTTPQLVQLPDDNKHQRWYRTGDLVTIHDDNLFYQGRVDFQFKIAGQRLSPEPIEQQVLELFGLECVLAPITLKNSDCPQKIHVVFLSEVTDVEISALTSWFNAELPPILVPKKMVQCLTPPRTTSGKIDRQKLIALANDDFYPSLLKGVS